MERDDEHFDLDDDFVAETEEEQNYDRFIETKRAPRPGTSREGVAVATARAG